MTNKLKSGAPKARLSVSVDSSVYSAIDKLSDENNLSFSAQLRSLVIIGLREQGYEVRANQVVNH